MNNGDILTASFFNTIENNIQNNNKILIIEINDSENNNIATDKYTFTQINNLINQNYFIVFKLKIIEEEKESTPIKKTAQAIDNSFSITNITYRYFYIIQNNNNHIKITNNDEYYNITLVPDAETDYLIYEV